MTDWNFPDINGRQYAFPAGTIEHFVKLRNSAYDLMRFDDYLDRFQIIDQHANDLERFQRDVVTQSFD